MKKVVVPVQLMRKMPAPVVAKFWSLNQVGELDGHIALPVQEGSNPRVWYDRQLYPIVDAPFSAYAKTIITEDGIWFAYKNPIRIVKYDRSSLTRTYYHTLGDLNSRLQGFIRLSDGRLVLVWIQFGTVIDPETGYNAIRVKFAVSPDWQETPEFLIGPSYSGCWGTLSELGNQIYFLMIRDASSKVALIRLNMDLSLDFLKQDWISDGVIKPDPELPKITSVVDGNYIYAAYESANRFFVYHPDGHPKAVSYIVVMRTGVNLIPELVESTPCLTERVSQFAFGVKNSQWWLGYGKYIPDIHFHFNDLTLYKNGEETYLGELSGGTFSQAIDICNTSNLVIGYMEDNKTHFYGVV